VVPNRRGSVQRDRGSFDFLKEAGTENHGLKKGGRKISCLEGNSH